MNTSQRVDVNPSDINEPHEESVRGVTVQMMLSPFDVPKTAEAEFDTDARMVRLRFSYLGTSEATVEKSAGDGVCLLVGKHSGRLYGINLALVSLVERGLIDSDLLIKIEDQVAKYSQVGPRARAGSFEAVHRVLNKYSADFLPVMHRALTAAHY